MLKEGYSDILYHKLECVERAGIFAKLKSRCEAKS